VSQVTNATGSAHRHRYITDHRHRRCDHRAYPPL